MVSLGILAAYLPIFALCATFENADARAGRLEVNKPGGFGHPHVSSAGCTPITCSRFF